MGRLIDADRLKEVFSRNVVGGNAYFDLIDNAPTVEAIPKADYENRLKADMVAMLTEIQLEIEENQIIAPQDTFYDKKLDGQFNKGIFKASDIIQEKINSLKEG